ncbi:MAG: SDR family NAD(P)-dependent oxidoreductase [Bdellovibrionales bacterium]|nr:SDR family NAD(P)-dependent oxidoreductase [Bdellovibrionales bacterium]
MLEDEVIWITGASSGIGEALALELGKQKTRLALSARSGDKLEQLVQRVRALGQAQAHAFPLDVLDRVGNRSCVAQIRECFGSEVSIFVPCAGTYKTSDSLHRYSSDEHIQLMQLNFFSLLYGIEAVLPAMLERKHGQIVGVSSLVGYFGLPRAFGYSASKGAIINALQSLRFELRNSGVQVKCVNPGFVKTPLTDKNDFEMPFLVTAEFAARKMIEALHKERFETHFPLSLSLVFKFLRILPQPLFEWIIKKVVYRGR